MNNINLSLIMIQKLIEIVRMIKMSQVEYDQLTKSVKVKATGEDAAKWFAVHDIYQPYYVEKSPRGRVTRFEGFVEVAEAKKLGYVVS